MNQQKEFYNYLDSYRFLAVFLVILTHWLPSYFEKLPLSKIGVDMFFVLSGFLITEILIKQKKEFNSSEIYNKQKKYVSFYIRRSLRIFPIYYFVILFFYLLSTPIVINNLNYFLFYATNLLVIKNREWIGMFSHLWSLAIEEQFYLVWPILILTIPFRNLKKLILLIIGLSVSYLLYGQLKNLIFSSYSLFSCMSTLGVGALLAYLKTSEKSKFKTSRIDFLVFAISLVIILLCTFQIIKVYILLHISIFIFSFYLIKILITQNSKALDYTFGNKITTYLGRISYGLYLYHNFIPWFLRNLTGSEKEITIILKPIFKPAPNGVLNFGYQLIGLLLISIISWHIIEKPINNLKKHFKYNS